MTEETSIDCLIVTGMQQSGISVMAACLDPLGVALVHGGKNPNIASQLRPSGLDDVFSIHDTLLTDLGHTQETIGDLPIGWADSRAAARARERIRDLIDVHREKGGPWAVADPQLCRLIPLWRTILREKGLQPGYVVVVRHPWEVAASLEKERGIDHRLGHLLWLDLYKEVFRLCRKEPVSVVCFDRILADPMAIIREVEETLGLVFPNSLERRANRIQSSIQPERKHHHVSLVPETDPSWTSLSSISWLYDQIYYFSSDPESRHRYRAPIQEAFETLVIPDSVDRLVTLTRDLDRIKSIFDDGAPRGGAHPAHRPHAENTCRPAVETVPSGDGPGNRGTRPEGGEIRIQSGPAETVMTPICDEGTLEAIRQRFASLDREKRAMAKEADALSVFRLLRNRVASLKKNLRYLYLLRKIGLRKDVMGLFDASGYRNTYLPAAESKVDPLVHYLKTGFAQGCRPNPLFHGDWYRETHPTVADTGMNPLVHYIRFGKKEGLRPNPLFDVIWYADHYPEVAQSGIDPLLDYLTDGMYEGRRPNPLFFTDWYLSINPDVVAAGTNPLSHYLDTGEKEGRDPNPLFDTDWYLETYPDVAAAGMSPLAHYLDTGEKEGRDPNPLFDTDWYLETYPDVAAAGMSPLAHYLDTGEKEGRAPNPLFDVHWYRSAYPEVVAAGTNCLGHYLRFGTRGDYRPNPLFDSQWYRSTYPDVGAVGTNPLSHYLSFGAKEGRNPHPLFDTAWYLDTYPDVAAAGTNSLEHFLVFGAVDGRDPTPLFHTAWYLEAYPEVAAAGDNPLVHYLETGARNGFDPCPLFDTNWYLSTYPEVAAAGRNPLSHFLTSGAARGYNPHPLFDTAWYLDTYPDVAAAGINPLEHYLRFGAVDGRNPNPLFHTRWYLETYPDVAASGIHPLVHFLQSGVAGGFDPNPLFQVSWYVERYPEVSVSGIHPLAHYLRFGKEGGFDPNPLFHTQWYLETYPDVVAAGVHPLVHFFASGTAECRDPNPLFRTAWYLKTYPDVATSDMHPLAHYLIFGVVDDRDPNPLFDTSWYLTAYPEVAAAGQNPLAHYLTVGAEKGYDPNPLFDTSWYLSTYPDVSASGAHPLAHFMEFCVADDRDPNPLFDTSWYLSTYPEVAAAGKNPLAHYLRSGHRSGYDPNSYFDGKWYRLTYMGDSADMNPLDHYLGIGVSAGYETVPPENAQSREVSGRLVTVTGSTEPVPAVSNGLNVLFVLYGGASSNSGYQACYHAERLWGRGHRCIIAVPEKEKNHTDLGDNIVFPILGYRDIETIGLRFGNGRGPDIVHAWTPREACRCFCQRLKRRYDFTTIVHLEDNESHLTEAALAMPWTELGRLPTAELDRQVPDSCYHPVRGRRWLGMAAGMTMVIDTLQVFNDAKVPSLTLMPAVDERLFYPRPINWALRKRLNIPKNHLVLVYTGNVHAANEREVAALYRAVALLGENQCPATLIRTGRSKEKWRRKMAHAARFVKEMGWVDRDELPDILAAADLFVQPGEPGPFNDLRVPCKLPEYFAMGRPVILPETNIGKKVVHGKDGYVVKRADARGIVDAVMDIRENRNLAKRLTSGSVDFYMRHIASPLAASHLDVFYRKIIDRAPKKTSSATGAPMASRRTVRPWELFSFLEEADAPGPMAETARALERAFQSALTVVSCVETALEKQCFPEKDPWIGFVHALPVRVTPFLIRQPPYKGLIDGALFLSSVWKRARSGCRGLFVQSREHARRLAPIAGVPVHSLRLPLPKVKRKWSWKNFAANGDKKVVQVGWFAQRPHAVAMLPVRNMGRVWVKKEDPALDAVLTAERRHLEGRRILFDFMVDTVHIPSGFGSIDGMHLLEENIVFSHYYDSIHMDLVLMCIAYHAPLLINPFQAFRDLLGDDYPLYYFSYAEAAEKAADAGRIREAHEHLRRLESEYDWGPEHMAAAIEQRISGEAN